MKHCMMEVVEMWWGWTSCDCVRGREKLWYVPKGCTAESEL